MSSLLPAPLIKICGIKSASALDACIAAQIDYIGLVFFPKSPRNVSIDQAAALAQRASGKTKVVALFVNPDADLIEAVRAKVSLDVIQLHGSETPDHVAQISAQHNLEVWKAIGIRKREDFAKAQQYHGTAHRILYDAKPPEGSDLPGGTGLRIDWSLFTGQAHPLPWILAGGLNPDNVAEAMRRTAAPMIDASSGVESAPGVKDVDKIASFAYAAKHL